MSEKYIEKTYKKEDKEKKDENGKPEVVTITTKYRVDADFVPTTANEICQEFIIAYCEAKGEDDWLAELFTKKVIKEDKNGNKKEVELTALEVRKAFIEKFFPNLATQKKAKSAKELFLERYKAKKK